MRAAVIDAFGSLSVREVPEPTLVSASDVIVRVHAAGVCQTDLETINGGLVAAYGVPEFPYVPGHETAGVVEATGSAVSSVAIGDRVLLHPLTTCGLCAGCRSGMDMYCVRSTFAGVDAKTWGGWAELVRVGERALVRLPPDGDLTALAPYSDAGLTAYHAVERIRHCLDSSSQVVVLGAGGVGHFAVQLLVRTTPARVFVIDPSEDRLNTAVAFGADGLPPANSTIAQIETVRDRTDGGADVVMEFSGAPGTTKAGLAMLRKGGVLSVIGAGPDLEFNTLDAVVRELSIVCNIVGTHSELEKVVALHGTTLESPHETFPLEAVDEAISRLAQCRIDGRAVLVP